MNNKQNEIIPVLETIPPGFSAQMLLRFYEQMYLLREFELTAQKIYRKGEWPGFIHLYVGQEATAVGVCAHLNTSDWITSTHRGHGHALAKGLPSKLLMAELAGKSTGCCGGRGGSMHLFHIASGLFGTNGLVGAGIPLAVGVALKAKLDKRHDVAVAFFGDGAVNHGAFHESLNFAAVQNAPAIFVCENNLYATATPFSMATRNTNIASKAAAYGMPGVAVDGNDVVAVWECAREAIERARNGDGPTLIEARTYRTLGHHEGDQVYGTYRTQAEVERWKELCPILQLRRRLVDTWQIADEEQLRSIEERVDKEIQEAVLFSKKSPDCDPATVHQHIWGSPLRCETAVKSVVGNEQTKKQSWLEAVRDGIAEEMRRNADILYLGEGIGERGGSFAHTKQLWQEFGAERVIDTPISELGFTGAAIGAAAAGSPAVADLMFAEFLFEAASQIVNQAAKLHYMSNGQIQVPVVIRTSAGISRSAGAHHSGMYHPMWAHVPGLVVAVPSTPADAKGLMKTALRCGNPVIFLEHKMLFNTKGEVPAVEDALVPFGQARIARQGSAITIVTSGLMLHRCLDAAQQLEAQGINCEVIDLRTIVPLDLKTIIASLSKTRRLLVVDEGWSMCGLGAEISAAIMEQAFDSLSNPVGRLHTEAVIHPFSPQLENAIIPSVDKIVEAIRSVLDGHPPVAFRPQMEAINGLEDETELKSGSSVPLSQAKAENKAAQAMPHAEYKTEPLCMPHGNLTSEGGTIVRWIKQEGDHVGRDEPVVEVETDKAVVEVESPVEGTLTKIMTPLGSAIQNGETLGLIRVSD